MNSLIDHWLAISVYSSECVDPITVLAVNPWYTRGADVKFVEERAHMTWLAIPLLNDERTGSYLDSLYLTSMGSGDSQGFWVVKPNVQGYPGSVQRLHGATNLLWLYDVTLVRPEQKDALEAR